MKKRSVLNKQSVKRKKQKKKVRSVNFRPFLQVCPIFLKCTLFLLIAAGISVSLMYCYHCLLTSSHMKLEKVDIRGIDQEIGNDLIDRCNLSSDQNLLALSLKDLKKKMERHPWIRSVTLERNFPNTLVVHAEKHVPSALVVLDELYFMNRHSEIFMQAKNAENVDFPIITGVFGYGRNAQRQLRRATKAITILASQKKPWSLNELSEIHIHNDGIILYFNHLSAKINVLADDLEYKMLGLKKVAGQLRKEGRIHRVTGIDLNSMDGAVVTFGKG